MNICCDMFINIISIFHSCQYQIILNHHIHQAKSVKIVSCQSIHAFYKLSMVYLLLQGFVHTIGELVKEIFQWPSVDNHETQKFWEILEIVSVVNMCNRRCGNLLLHVLHVLYVYVMIDFMTTFTLGRFRVTFFDVSVLIFSAYLILKSSSSPNNIT